MSNHTLAIIEALEEVECAARELYANMVDVEENVDIEGKELGDVGELREALESLDYARQEEAKIVALQKEGESK